VLRKRQHEQEQISEALRSRAERMESEVYQRAQEVAEINRQLQQKNLEIGRARELADQAREAADRANEGKSRFLATASHDLRQPLQTLALLNGSLRRIVTAPEAAEALSQQELAIGAVSRLLNALLDISKLESGAVKPQPSDFAVRTLFEELQREFADLARSKGLVLRVEPSTYAVHSDPALVGQILRNLVSNALKYTQLGAVRLRCRRDGAGVWIEVVDSGIGIPASQLPNIYDEFFQVGIPTNSWRDGYGLGLSIVQRLVRLLGLRLEVQSELGTGSTFALLLPPARTLRTEPDSAVAGSSARTPPIRNAHVLLVEDDPAVRGATRLLLNVEGYRVTAVASMAEAMQKSREEERIDLLLTDYHLSAGETGLDVLTAVRQTLGVPLKAVLITGDTSSAIRALRTDPNLRIASKPIEAEELLLLLRGMLAG
jgi:signal transduction histidine kinase